MKQHLFGCLTDCIISDVKVLKARMHEVARLCKFNVVSEAFHQFEPFGATGVLVLAESHFSAHTYPEEGKIYIDVFCCGPNFKSELCSQIIEMVFEGVLTWKAVDRTV